MGGIGGIKPLFGMNEVRKYAEDQLQKIREKQLLVMQKMGEDFIDAARSKRTYKDRTGNLRASVGYVIAEDGEVLESSFPGAGNAGAAKGEDYAKLLASERYNQGLVLIGVAGMQYALFVEARGYDVITGSRPSREQMLELLNEIK